MMKFEPTKIRNFVVAGHSGCGKTTLCDLMLYKAKAVDRLGSVDRFLEHKPRCAGHKHLLYP